MSTTRFSAFVFLSCIALSWSVLSGGDDGSFNSDPAPEMNKTETRSLPLTIGLVGWADSGAFSANVGGFGFNAELATEIWPRWTFGGKVILGLAIPPSVQFFAGLTADYTLFDNGLHVRTGVAIGYYQIVSGSPGTKYDSIAFGPRVLVGYRLWSNCSLGLSSELFFVIGRAGHYYFNLGPTLAINL